MPEGDGSTNYKDSGQPISPEECKSLIDRMDANIFSKQRVKDVISNPAALKEFKALLSKVEYCLEKSDNEDLEAYSLYHSNPEIRQMAKKLLRPRKEEKSLLFRLGFIPRYTEMALFLMGYAFILLLASSRELFDIVFKITGSPILVLIVIIGMVLSIYNIFTNRRKLDIEKNIILIFAIFTNFIVGAYGGVYALKHSQGIWAIFPIFNIASVFFLAFMFRAGVIKESSVLDENPRKSEIILGIIFVTIIFFISQNVLNNYWAITFSMCIFYATNLNEIFDKIILKRK